MWFALAGLAVSAAMSYMGGEDEKDRIDESTKRQQEEQRRVAAANKELSLYDARVAERVGLNKKFEADAQAGLMYKELQKVLGTQRSRIAKSGVSLKEGSAVDVMKETSRRAAKDIMNIKYKGRSAQEAANSQAAKYRMLAEKGMRDAAANSALIAEAAADQKSAIGWQQVGNLVSTAGKVAETVGWF